MRRIPLIALLVVLLSAMPPLRVQPAAHAATTALPLQVEFVDNIGGGVPQVAMVDGYAYVTEGVWLSVFDLSNPHRFFQQARIAIHEQEENGTPVASAIQGNYLYALDGGGWLTIFDISARLAPSVVKQLRVNPADPAKIVFDGSRAYIAQIDTHGGTSIEVVDITTPAEVVSLGTLDLWGTLGGIAVRNNQLFFADRYGSLEIYDIQDLMNPTLIGNYGENNNVEFSDVQLEANRAYLGANSGGIHVVNIQDPANPTLVGSYQPPTAWESTGELEVHNGLVYVAVNEDTNTRLEVVNLSNSASPNWIASVRTKTQVQQIERVGAWLSIVDRAAWQLVDMQNASSPTPYGHYPVISYAQDVQLQGDDLFVASEYGGGLQVVDTTVPDALMQRGNYAQIYASSVDVKQDLAYVTDPTSAGGLHILDVQQPNQITHVGHFITNQRQWDIQVVGSLAYMATEKAGLRIVDVSNPAQPVLHSKNLDTLNTAHIQVEGNLAYVLDNQNLGGTINRFCTVNIANPAAPTTLGCYNDTLPGEGLSVSNGLAYIATGQNLKLIDVSNPAAPALRYTYARPTWGVHVVGARAYVAVADGLEVLDFSNPTSPVLLGEYKGLSWRGGRMALTGYRLYVAAGWLGVLIFDVGAPRPWLEIDYPAGAPGSSFTLSGAEFPPQTELAVAVNGTAVGTLTTDATGALSATLSTAADAAPGLYVISANQTAVSTSAVSVAVEPSTSFRLQADAPLRSPDPVGSPLAVPSTIAAIPLKVIYLPLALL